MAHIQPIEIANYVTEDVPNLRINRFDTPLPGEFLSDPVIGNRLSNGFDTETVNGQMVKPRWDISRQVRVRIKSPTVGAEGYADKSGVLVEGLPSANRITVKYPSSPLIGNDDSNTVGEVNDPYFGDQLPDGNPNQFAVRGDLFSIDQPQFPVIAHQAGINGDKIDWHIQFREFVRVQIGTKWYRISSDDDGLWRHRAILEKRGGFWRNAGSVTEANNKDW